MLQFTKKKTVASKSRLIRSLTGSN